jgi:hypothetical protein
MAETFNKRLRLGAAGGHGKVVLDIALAWNLVSGCAYGRYHDVLVDRLFEWAKAQYRELVIRVAIGNPQRWVIEGSPFPADPFIGEGLEECHYAGFLGIQQLQWKDGGR